MILKPHVGLLEGFGPQRWWCTSGLDAKPFDTWPEALSYALSLTDGMEVTA
ncbi:hypothetical protein [Plantibacter sp. YIM 135347]|uniref:hypothetical protein n=1 Tax=Plantibacter sp. YIM 135347 TaxID=3423919 RepID=UPI003D347DBB